MVAVARRTSPPDLASALLDYFRVRLETVDLQFAEKPSLLPDGCEAIVYRFQLHSRRPLPPGFSGPLILRAYAHGNGLTRMRNEFDIQRHVGEHGYPVARPLLLEAKGDLFGGPFLIMEWVPGRTLLQVLLHHYPSIWWAPASMADLHARLHRLPVPDLPWPREPFLARSLAAMETQIQDYQLYGLAAGFDWLENHQPLTPAAACLLHLDFHPINLMYADGRCTAVLDWSDAEVGDSHADVAVTVLLTELNPVDLRLPRERIAAVVGKSLLKRWYLQAYEHQLPLDPKTLRYYLAWAALRRLCRWGSWLRAGPAVSAYKASAVRILEPDRLAYLCRSFRRRTGVTVHVD